MVVFLYEAVSSWLYFYVRWLVYGCRPIHI